MKENSRFISFLGGKSSIFGLLMLILIGVAIWIFNQVSFIFTPFLTIIHTIIGPIILAFVFYYLLNPVVDILERYRIKRLYGIIILILTIIGGLALGITLLVPLIETQATRFVKDFPSYMKYISQQFDHFSQTPVVGDYLKQAQEWVTNHIGDLQKKVTEYLAKLPTKLRPLIDTVASVAVVILTFPFVLFFLLKDGDKFKRYFVHLMPPKYRQDTHDLLNKMSVQVGSYIQGQLIVSFCIGILLFIGYLIIGLDYALVLASIAAVTSVVPYLGPMIAISPAVIVALVHSPWMLLKLAVVWVAVQFFEGHFISPNIMGKTMQIHPLTIIFVLLCAGKLGGVIGVIIAIPTYAIIRVLVSHLFEMFKKRYNRFYAEDAGRYEE